MTQILTGALGVLLAIAISPAVLADDTPIGSLKAVYSAATGIGPEKGVMRRDPSDIIKVDDLYYVWYSKGKIAPGYDAAVWYATSPDGHKWTEKGMALSKGKAGTWEGASVFTPNILVAEGRYWLFYTGTSRKFSKGFNPDSKIGIAVSDSPDGPWESFASNPALKNSDNREDFDSHLVDDACLIVRHGKYWLYYKGRQLGKGPGQTQMGVAVADKPVGPYVKYENNPVIPGNHEVIVWPQGTGVAAMIGTTGPKKITRSILYAEDGLQFTKTHDVIEVPHAAGAFRPEAFTDSGMGKPIQWGVHIGKRRGFLPFIERFDLVKSKPGPERAEKMRPRLPEIRQARSPRPVREPSADQPVSTAQDTRRVPNFVVIFVDDLGYGDISCYGPTGVETPHLDALAAEGFRSTDFFVPANVCSPSRAALLTGRYPMRCGMPVARNEGFPKYKNYGFAADEITIPELLKPAGYRSLMVGKWHLGMEVEGSHPIDAGFDEHLGIPSNYAPRRGKNHNTLYRGKEVEERNVPCELLTKRYTDEVVAFIERQKEDPFFIYVSHHIVHTPLLPSKDFVGTSKKGKYGDFIKELDHSTGRIMKAIRDAGLNDNTLVVFTSDNGPTGTGSTGGLNGGKYCTMEGGHRVPGVFRWPGKIPSGQVSSTTISSMDLLPLFCELADVELPADRKIDGKNIFPILKGEATATPHEFLYYYNGTNLQAVREGNWKLHLPRTARDQPFWSKKPSKKKGFVTLKERQLFDLKNDAGEKRNIADRYPEVVARLQKQAETIRAELGDVRTTGTDQRKINLVDPQER